MAAIDEQTLRKNLVRRLGSMKGVRSPWEAHWGEVARYTQPRLGRNLNGQSRQQKTGQELNSKLQNDQGIWASEVLANGMATGMTSASMPWFRLTTEDPDLREWQDVKEWLDIVQDRLYDFFAKTNFYTAGKSGYLELGVFGTSATIMVEHPELNAVNWNMTAGDYWIGLNDGGVPDTLFRRADMTATQLCQRFGIDKISGRARQAYDRGDYFMEFPVFHAVEPNLEREYGKADNTNMKYRSVYWEMPQAVADTRSANAPGYGYDKAAEAVSAGDKPLLEFSGFEERPFWAPRWDVTGYETYGRSPGMSALPTLRALQTKEVRKQQAADYVVRPALRGPTSLNNVHSALIPGHVTTVSSPDKDVFGAIWTVPVEAVSMLDTEITRLESKVDRSFYANLFMAITNMPGVQPRTIEEIAKRNEEALSQLGPAVDRNNTEQLRVAIDRAFGILNRRGDIPPAPPEMHGAKLQIEFTSILAQMQRAVGLQSGERFISFAGNLAGEDPSVLDVVNKDETLRDYGDRVGAPAKWLNPPEVVAQIRAARQQQQIAAQAATLAPAAKDGAMAARLMAETRQLTTQ